MSEYFPTIGLEIHAELKTRTKMFCDTKNDPNETRPNVNICPICTAQPGTLPVINREAVKHVLKVGVACGSELADYSEFDRKNYFYPDIPKGYQISQYKYPLVSGGSLNEVALTRIHLEEDTASSQHFDDYSLVDFNRAGVPLMELVTEPVMHDAVTAGHFARELQLLLRYLGASEANMEKGQMRLEANVSVMKLGLNQSSGLVGRTPQGGVLGTKVEVKNINSFRALEKAIEYEIKRQSEELESGGVIVQETRGWDDVKNKTFSQRKKESSHDYRYFPEPDLPKLKLSEVEEFSVENLYKTLPELPSQKRERYQRDYGIKLEDIESYVTNLDLANFFESVAEILKDKDKVKLASNYITSDLVGHLVALPLSENEEYKLPSHEHFAKLIEMIARGDLSSRGGKDVLAIMHKEGGDPEVIAKDKGLIQKHDEGELTKIVDKVINENDKVWQDFKSGKEASLQFLIGQGMKLSKGSANPNLLKKILLDKLV
ncbi:MAG: Asp-tRNA(Asn)/Glu-tRNA(Gln) amidotransferase subunit GatB [Patescibacteria group bacterium]